MLVKAKTPVKQPWLAISTISFACDTQRRRVVVAAMAIAVAAAAVVVMAVA
jgi:hypothetical protein